MCGAITNTGASILIEDIHKTYKLNDDPASAAMTFSHGSGDFENGWTVGDIATTEKSM